MKATKKEQTPLEKSVEEILKYRDNLLKKVENSQDVKDGNCTADDEKKEPGFLLYNAIIESSVEILQKEPVVKLFSELSGVIGEDTSHKFVELLAICMSQSAYNAITFYDQLLKGEITMQFDHYGKHLNALGAEVNAHKGSLEVFQKRLSDIENTIKINEVKSKIDK